MKRAVFPCGLCFCLGVAATLAIVSQTVWSNPRGERWQRAVSHLHPARSVTDANAVPPWGVIEFLKIPLINPDEFFLDRAQRLKPPEWFFENFSEARVREFLDTCDLTAAERERLGDRQFWNVTTNGCTLFPPDDVLWSLDAGAREKIYSTLAKSAGNYAQCYPFRFPPEGFDARFSESGLSRHKLGLIRKLTYMDCGCLCFADLQTLQNAFTKREFSQAVGALYHIPAYRLRLQVMPDSDIASLVKYWGKGGREKIIKPLLDSLGHVPGGASISASVLLPPFARLRLYTFPDSWNDPTAARQDCFFTSLNFFNEMPNTNFFDREYAMNVLRTDYAKITDEPTFGDLILLLNPAGEGIHCCVYIAEDFVFTKNGVNNLQPWVLMRMSDMTAYYPAEKGARIVILRRKESGAQPAPGSGIGETNRTDELYSSPAK